MNNQKGFTLVELVVVIVILGILSAVAVPKFIDMQEDAKKSAVEGARGAVKSAVALAHARWMADGADPANNTVEMEGISINVDDFGYPTVESIAEAAGIDDDFAIDPASPTAGSAAEITIYRSSETLGNGTWSFTYTQATITNDSLTTPPQVGDIEEYQE
jgi:MSHA pilin protein MshA